MYYIFLDVDGVLNTENDWKRPFSLNKKCVDNFLLYIGKLRAKNKEELRVILTSSWKTGFNKNGSHAPHIEELMKYFLKEQLFITDKTTDFGDDRGKSVEAYIKQYGISANKYIVFDDDKALFPSSPNLNVYYTNSKTGFTEKDIKKAVPEEKRAWYDIFKIAR